jgi:hypothetical protein
MDEPLANLAVVLLALSFGGLFLPIQKKIWHVEVLYWVFATAACLIGLQVVVDAAVYSPMAGGLVALVLVLYIAHWIPSSHRRVVVEAEDVIPAPPAAVFAVATNLSAWPRLFPGLLSARTEDGGAIHPGSRIVSRLRSPRIDGVDVMVEFDPPRRYADRTLETVENLTTVSFAPSPEGTRVTYRADQLLSIPNAILVGYNKGAIRKGILKRRLEWFRNLKRELETTKSS